MAETKPTPTLDYETLNLIAARLSEHADAITNAARQDIANDLRLAARIADKMADLRFRVAEIAEQALAHPEWDRAAFARDLRAALADAAEGD
jgi:hypothetical protein